MNWNILREATENLLNCGDDIGSMKRPVDQLYALFSEITGVTSDDLNEEHIFLASGKAISSSSAAFCLMEFKRTVVFLRGIDQVIMQKIAEHSDRKIRILYAGTGPYATLITPLLSLYSPEKIVVDLLDINSKSLNAVVKLFNALQFNLFIGNVYNCDAATFKLENDYDIVVSETMQAALKNEPQVAIMKNLIPQMAPDSTFIPQSITVKAVIALKGYPKIDEDLTVVEKELAAVGMQNPDIDTNDLVEMELPAGLDDTVALLLATTITVFDDHLLRDCDCTLTFPVKVCTLEPGQQGIIRFWYETGSLPGFRCRFNEEEKVHVVVGKATTRW